MWKKVLIAGLAVFVAWVILDLVIHSAILSSAYEKTADMWRPTEEIMTWLNWLVVLIAAFCFVAIYTYLISPKSMNVGLLYGLISGIATGVSMGYGTYSVMPIPQCMALTWLLGVLVEAVVGGAIVALIVKESATA